MTVSECGDGETIEGPEKYYLEVKTHTPTSDVRDQINLSNEQLKLASSEGDHYSILNVIYDRSIKDGVSITELRNPILQIGKGRLAGTQKRYIFLLRKAA